MRSYLTLLLSFLNLKPFAAQYLNPPTRTSSRAQSTHSESPGWWWWWWWIPILWHSFRRYVHVFLVRLLPRRARDHITPPHPDDSDADSKASWPPPGPVAVSVLIALPSPEKRAVPHAYSGTGKRRAGSAEYVQRLRLEDMVIGVVETPLGVGTSRMGIGDQIRNTTDIPMHVLQQLQKRSRIAPAIVHALERNIQE